ncbi:MAG: heparinase II/III family protein [Chitinophagaceae bacterium]
MKIYKLSAAILLLFITIGSVKAQTDYVGSRKFASHPRILLLGNEEATIKKTIAADAALGKLQQAILQEADKMIDLPPVERIKIGRRLLDKSREALRRLFFLSYAYRMTGEKKYAQRAEKEMLAVSAFEDWNPTHFLDVAEMTTATAIGYDWLYNYLSPESKATIRRAILEKGIKPSLDTKYNNNWLHAEHNWNQVCNTGMAYGAMAIYEDEPALAKEIINRAINSIPSSMHDYGPDGIYPEGYNYWGYGTSFNVLFIAALDKLFGEDFGLSDKPGFLKTAGFLENMTGPTDKPFNYSDSGDEGGLEPAMFWFASRTKNPSLLWVEHNRLIQKEPKRFVQNRLLPGVLLWSGGINFNNAQAPASTVWAGKGKNPIALMRTSWTDTNAIYVAAKGGSGAINHAHMDVGSFVMDANGERWAMDFGRQEYESLESKGLQIFGRTQDAQRWTIFRLVNQTHNTLTVNDKHQWIAGFAPMESFSSSPSFMNVVFDISEAYKNQLEKAKRGIAIVDKKYVVVRDEVTAADTVTTIRWTLLTPANVNITGKNTAELSQHGKKLLMRVETSNGEAIVKTWPTNPPPADYDAPNPGTIRTGFEITLPAKASTVITVSLIPEDAIKLDSQKIKPLSAWTTAQ